MQFMMLKDTVYLPDMNLHSECILRKKLSKPIIRVAADKLYFT